MELSGKRVGVIGTGSERHSGRSPDRPPSLIRLSCSQRTPSWVLPHLGHPVIERTKKLFALLPFSQRLVRAYGYWRRELMVLGFVKDPRRMTQAEETMSRDHLETPS